MCAWCGRGFLPSDRNSSRQFCSLRCQTRHFAFQLQRSLSQLRRTQVQHILDNWHSLPKSGHERVAWLWNGARAAGAKAKAASAPPKSDRPQVGSKVKRSAGSGAHPAPVPQDLTVSRKPIEKVGVPWNGEGVAELIGVQDDLRLRLFNCSPTLDRGAHLGEGHSWQFTVPDAGGTAILKWEQSSGSATTLNGLTGFGVSLFVPEPDKITDFGLWAFTSNGGRFRWSSENFPAPGLKKGWNHLRFSRNWMQYPLDNPKWGDVDGIQIYVQAVAATSFNLGQVWAETRPKASLVFIHDGGYSGFDQSPGYYDLAARGIPVTWSIDCALIGDEEHVSRDRLIEVGNENGNSISFHGWDSSVSGDYTDAAQAREETAKCQQWIENLPTAGNTGRKWRTAWMQNNSPFSPATNNMVELNPMWDPDHEPPRGATMWPLVQPYNYRREALHHLSPRDLQELFEDAKETHGVLVCYTHNIGEGTKHISPERWEEFLELVDEGLNSGWLEGVTFEALTAHDRQAD